MSEEVFVDVNGHAADEPDSRRASREGPVVAPKPKKSISGSVSEPPAASHQSHHHQQQQQGGHLSAEQMDEQRKQNIAYEYLCHLEESKVWIQACINEELPPTTELEEGLRNGVYLGKLAHFMAPNKVPLKKIYDKDQARFKARGLHFRHTDNLNQWFQAMEEVGLPRIFYPETTDIYDRKNMPRTIYCLHALSLYLFKLGMAPQIEDLYGKVNFTEEEISAMRQELDKYGIQMPTFSKIGGILANELSQDDAALHAAIIAINEAIETQVVTDIMSALGNPAANLVGINKDLDENYTVNLYGAKQTKSETAKNKRGESSGDKEFDVYDEMLTQAEIQGNLNLVNTTHTLSVLNTALQSDDKETLLKMLKSSHLGIKNVKDENIEHYMAQLMEARKAKKGEDGEEIPLDKDEIQQAINKANLEADAEYQKMLAVTSVNTALETRDCETLMKTLQHPKSQLPYVYDFAGMLYLEEFCNMRDEKNNELDYDEVYAGVKVLSSIANINQCVDTGDSEGTFKALSHDNACLQNLDEENSDRYQTALVEAKTKKQGESCNLLTHSEVTDVIDQVNSQVEEEHARILAISKINEYIDKGKPEDTLQMLKLPEAKLCNVDDKQAYHYQVLLIRKKKQKAEKQGDESAELWLDEIQESIDKANTDARDGVEMSMGVAAVNDAVDADDHEALTTSLALPGLGIQNVRSDCAHTYLEELQSVKDLQNADRRAYCCRFCSRSGQKCRIISHIYRDHIPTDRLPFYCSLCHFRCEKEAELKHHLTEYQPHQQADLRAGGVKDLTPYLHKASDPYFVGAKDLIQLSVEESRKIFNKGLVAAPVVEESGQLLPGWLASLPPPPPAVEKLKASPLHPQYTPTPKHQLNIVTSDRVTSQNQYVPEIINFDEDLFDITQDSCSSDQQMPPTPLQDEALLPSNTDMVDPQFLGYTDSVCESPAYQPPVPVVTSQPPVPIVASQPPVPIVASQLPVTVVESSVQTDAAKEDPTLKLLQRIASAAEEQVKVSLCSERKLHEVLSELRSLERKVHSIDQRVDNLSKAKKIHSKKF